jgi:hypothetical protein
LLQQQHQAPAQLKNCFQIKTPTNGPRIKANLPGLIIAEGRLSSDEDLRSKMYNDSQYEFCI